MLLAAGAVAVCVEAVVVDPDDRDRAGVIGAVTAAAFAVVVGRVRVEAGTAVVGVAFARFRFGGFFGFCFFTCFGLFPRAFTYRDLSRVPARRRTKFSGPDSARFAIASLRSGLPGFQRNSLPRFPLGA